MNIEVSVIIACLNEEKFIKKCINSLLNGDYPKDKIEILVVDGGSTDLTKDIVTKISHENPNVKLFDNPNRFSVFAFNIGIKNAAPSSKYITILNGHGSYTPERISKSVQYLNEHKVDAVGGLSKATSRTETLLGKSIAAAISSIFGSGGSFRTNISKPTIVDTASGTMYQKEVFNAIGLFNENLTYSQDIEFNLRLKHSGRKILLCPDLVTYYHSRADLKSFTKHNWRNGLWVILPFAYSSTTPVSLRHLIPLFFVLTLIFLGFFSIFFGIFKYFLLTVLVLYFGVNIIASLITSIEKKNLGLIFYLPVTYFLLHFTYGFGSLWGVIKLIQLNYSK